MNRRKFITGAAAIAAYSKLENASALTSQQLAVLLNSRKGIPAPTGGIYDTNDVSGWGNIGGITSKTANAAISPDLTQNASVILIDSSTGNHGIFKALNFSVLAQNYTYTVFARRISGPANLILHFWTSGFSGIDQICVDLGTQSVSVAPLSGSSTATTTPIDANWTKVVFSVLASVDTGFNIGIMPASGTSENYAGNGTNSIAVWGIDLR